MAIPKAVKKQAEEARRLTGDPALVETPESPPALEPDPVEQAIDAQDQQADQPTTAPAPAEVQSENWELRFRNYKAGTDETIHQLRQENAALKGEVADLKAKLEQQTASVGVLTDEEREDWGDIEHIIERVARQMVERELAPTREKIEVIAERSAETDRERFEEGLTRRVPNWRTINEDPKFIAWLQEADEFSGQLRTTLIHQAAASRDIDRVAAFFTAFAGASKAPTARRDPRERELPNTVRGDTPVSVKRTYSNDEIRKLYDQKRRGAYRGRDEEWRAIEADISAAVSEGRIR